MKLNIFVDKNHAEEVIIYTHAKNELTDRIEQLVTENSFDLIGFIDREAVTLNLAEIQMFVVVDNKIYAVTGNEKFYVRTRLYVLEEKLPHNFVKINQSCIANINHICRFDTSVSGTLKVKFKNGMSDYVSRRQLKNIKGRFGL